MIKVIREAEIEIEIEIFDRPVLGQGNGRHFPLSFVWNLKFVKITINCPSSTNSDDDDDGPTLKLEMVMRVCVIESGRGNR